MYPSKEPPGRPDRSDGQRYRPMQKPNVSTMTVQADEPQPMHRPHQRQVNKVSVRFTSSCSVFLNTEMSTNHRYMKTSALCELCLKLRHSVNYCPSHTCGVEFYVSPVTPGSHEVFAHAWAVDQLPPGIRLTPKAQQLSDWKHLAGLPLDDQDNQPISMLIRMDIPSAHWVLASSAGGHSEPCATFTPFGWTILGPLGYPG
ncbi:hypothetical protein D915_009778 [Fasciola hepatica]|uniref:Uncharacterized protein n=1 Tax=Fasciola hepatica TaxID=6192 RepID=A0A2H1BUV0_FASHE|nr:hypothetical protein D915_009778 [Fasciola hepatica]